MKQTGNQAGSGGNQWAVVAQGVCKQFNGEYAVRDLTISVPKGIIFGFVGPSGSGKTTTVRLLTGLYAPSEGTVSLLGHDPKHFTARLREQIGYMPQLFVLYPDLNVWENINFAASLYGLSLFRRQKRLMPLLDFVQLSEHRKKLARNISGGMQRRLALACTLVHNPQLIFLDEPTAGIDPILRQKFWEHFRELQASGRTLFVTTQYVGEAVYCDYVGVMIEGRLLMVDTPTGLRHRAFGGEVVDLQTKEPISFDQISRLQSLPVIKKNIQVNGQNNLRITVDEASTVIPEILTWCGQNNLTVDSVAEFMPPFDDVFVQIVQQETAHA
jgi:ABC-2 type transport system ATP-binding protein